MAEKNDNLNPNDPCREGGDCCPTPSSRSGLKTFLFTVIIVLAVGVGAYSLFLREPEQMVACGPGATCGPGTSCGPSSACGPTTRNTAIKATSYFGDQLNGLDCALLIFLREGDKLSPEQEKAVSSAMEALREKDIKTEVVTIPQSNQQFEAGIVRFGISKMPSVVVLCNSGRGVLDYNNISFETILDTFSKISSLPKRVS